jgi:hypothetical protein
MRGLASGDSGFHVAAGASESIASNSVRIRHEGTVLAMGKSTSVPQMIRVSLEDTEGAVKLFQQHDAR